MSLSLTQKVLENTQKQYSLIKRQSLQPVPQSKKVRLLTEENTQSIHQNSFELLNDEQTKKMKLTLYISKDLKKDQPNSTLKQKLVDANKQIPIKDKDYFNSNSENGFMKQRQSLGQLPSLKINNRNQSKNNDLSKVINTIKSPPSNRSRGDVKTQDQDLVVWDQGQQFENDISQQYGLLSPTQSQVNNEKGKLQDKITTSLSTKSMTKPTSRNPPRSSFLAQVPYYEQKAQEKRESIQQNLKKKKQLYKNFIDQLESRKQTFTKFSFKSYERDDNPFLNPLIQKVNNLELKGSMHVIDLWEDKALQKYLKYAKLRDGKYMLRGIAQQISQDLMQQKREVPTIFTKKDENILSGRLQDKDQMTNYLKQINDEYNKNDKILDRQIQKSGLSQAISRQSIIIPAETNFQNILMKKTSSIKQTTDQDQEFNDIEFIKSFYVKTQSHPSLINSAHNNYLSPNYISNSQNYLQIQNNSLSSTPTNERQSQKNYFFPSSNQQFEQKNKKPVIQDFIHSQNQTKKQNFLSIPIPMTESSPYLEKSTKNGLMTSESIYKGQQNDCFDDQQLSLPTSQNKLLYSSELNSTNYFNSKTLSELSKHNLNTPKNEKSHKQYSLNSELKQKLLQSPPNKYFGKGSFMNNYKSQQNHQKLNLEEVQSEMRTSLNTSRDITTPMGSKQTKKMREQQQNLAKINHMFKEIDEMQQQDLSQKKKMDDLIERIQDRVIVSIQNQKKKILDDDRMKNITNGLQE